MQWYFLKHPPRCQKFASEPKGLPFCSIAPGVFKSLNFSSCPLDPGKLLAKVCHFLLSAPVLLCIFTWQVLLAGLLRCAGSSEESQQWERFCCSWAITWQHPTLRKGLLEGVFPVTLWIWETWPVEFSLEISITGPFIEFHVEFTHHGE